MTSYLVSYEVSEDIPRVWRNISRCILSNELHQTTKRYLPFFPVILKSEISFVISLFQIRHTTLMIPFAFWVKFLTFTVHYDIVQHSANVKSSMTQCVLADQYTSGRCALLGVMIIKSTPVFCVPGGVHHA